MTTELKSLMALRSRAEQEKLQAELRRIALQVSAAGQYTAPQHVQAAVGAAAMSITAFCDAAFADYKAVVEANLELYTEGRLDELQEVFLGALRDEKRAMGCILEQRVGAIARHLSPAGLTPYPQFDAGFLMAFNAAESKVESYNKAIKDSASTFVSKVRANARSRPVTALMIGLLLIVGTTTGISVTRELIQKAFQ